MTPGDERPASGGAPGWHPPPPQPGQQPSGYPGHPPPQGYPPGYPGQQSGPYAAYPAYPPQQQPGGLTPPPPGGGGGNGGRGRAAVAVVVATAVLAAAVITGVFVLRGEDDEEGGAGEARESATASGGASESPSPTAGPTDGGGGNPDDPRQSVLPAPDPVVAPDWQVQTIENRHNAFDVPPGWQTGGDGRMVGYSDDREGSPTEGETLVMMSGVATYEDGWCEESEDGPSWHAAVGTKGAQGSTGTAEAAENEARTWARAAYDQAGRGRLRVSAPEPFASDHGISGHTVTATVTGVPEGQGDACGTFDGKVVTVSYLDQESDLATWVLVMDTGFEGELDDRTIEQMMNSLRPYP